MGASTEKIQMILLNGTKIDKSIHHVPDSSTDIVRFLVDHIENIAPAGVAALELHDVCGGDSGSSEP